MNNNNKGHKIRFNRVDVQVFLMTAVIVVFACGLIFLVNYSLSYGSMITALKERAENIHKYLENYLDVSSRFTTVPTQFWKLREGPRGYVIFILPK